MTADGSNVPSTHVPVLLDAVMAALAPVEAGVYVDGTFGAGGYATALLAAARCRVFGIDRDPDAVAAGKSMAERFAGRLVVLEGRFADMETLLGAEGVTAVDGVALDIGVSSMQLDRAERGFSFREDGPLDMRMSRHGPSAADVVNDTEEAELADIIFRLGEERRSRRVARAIAEARSAAPITRTLRLAEIVARAVGPTPGIHPATRTFQALRIYVNDELGELARGLAAAERMLKPQGRLAVVAFHSLEDRLVKRFLLARSGEAPLPSRHAPAHHTARAQPSFRLIARGTVKPSAAEIAANPRARSARLRAAERTSAPAMSLEVAA
jgi:16S rRNA (cytosine1402-N4)-methyltransferase